MREELYNLINSELIGPSSLLNNDKKFEMLSESPTRKYLSGVIFPQKTKVSMLDIDEESEELSNTEELLYDSQKNVSIENLPDEENDEEDSNLRFNENQDCCYLYGLSYAVKKTDFSKISINIKSGVYRKIIIESKEKFKRYQIDLSFKITDLTEDKLSILNQINYFSNEHTEHTNNNIQNLAIYLKTIEKDDLSFITLKVINLFEADINDKYIAEKCFFQNEISVSIKDAKFQSINSFTKNIPYHQDDINNKLLYLHKPSYAFGYNCSINWNEEKNIIQTSFMPKSIVKSIDHLEISEKFNMLEMGNNDNWEKTSKGLFKLCNKYESWINEQNNSKNNDLYSEYQEIIEKNISECLQCLNRMKKGLDILNTNSKVRYAFQLMNQAMHYQQMNSNIEYRAYNFANEKFEEISSYEKSKLGYWRLFQIAFILLNIEGLSDKDSSDREIVDLIWFATGGGKTEAYLALSSFCIFYRRLLNPTNCGVSVLMRYTLRLLTSQQFQRASTLICAMEYLRFKHPELGDYQISLGLWVGNSISPANYKDAFDAYKIYQDKGGENPFVITQCPWCGCQMGYVETKKNNKKIKKCIGYYSTKTDFYFKCANNDCFYSGKKLPLKVIDEAIYNNPPEFIISTLDKFALIPWNEKIKNIFNIENDNDSIDLIIQDELHLINGALGSVAGIYEILIQALIEKKGYKPKILASTATINRYREQIKNLYFRDNVTIFPKPILKFGETFFSYENQTDPGRLYVGVMPSSKVFFLSSQISFIAMLLFAVSIFHDHKKIDYYWTLILYFNNLKNLGFISAKIESNIRDRLNVLYNNLNHSNIPKRQYNLNSKELTSRINSQEIGNIFNLLKIEKNAKQNAVDVCLGTNMISVGIDVKRLGLMTIIGQPILTAEYIQCSSRVGRDKNGPGIVFVLYNHFKNRDLSVYEDFQSFHSRLYSYVEPSTITPYSLTAQKRLIHAIIVGYERMIKNSSNNKTAGDIDMDAIAEIKSFLSKRLDNHKEKAQIMKYFNNLVEDWENYCPDRYGNYFKQEIRDLMYPAGIETKESIDMCLWAMPLSMRSVEKECQIKIISNHEE